MKCLNHIKVFTKYYRENEGIENTETPEEMNERINYTQSMNKTKMLSPPPESL